jgi:methylenetetrahydrofolate reductase (NADPH)
MSLANEAAAGGNVKQQIIDLMSGFTAETTPGAAAKIADYRQHLRPGTTVYITFLPGSDFEQTIYVAKRLQQEGFNPVPHLAARSIPTRAFLERNLLRLQQEVGLTQALVIAGAVDKPLGEFSDSMQLLETGLFDRYGINKIGVAGHPEGSPDITEEAIKQALKWKNDLAERTGARLYVVTQFCFDAQPIIDWDRKIQAEGNRLPVYIGIPGLATLKTLLNHAKACGIGPSMRFLTKQARNLAKLMTVSAPDRLVTELARYRASDGNCGIAGVHMYPLGGLRKSAKWSYAVVDGEFTLAKDGKGFSVDADIS